MKKRAPTFDIKKEIETYTSLLKALDTPGLLESFNDSEGGGMSQMKMAERGFYNCMAYAAELSFNKTSDDVLGCQELLHLAKEFMCLAGLDKAPDSMPAVLDCIAVTAAFTKAALSIGLLNTTRGGSQGKCMNS